MKNYWSNEGVLILGIFYVVVEREEVEGLREGVCDWSGIFEGYEVLGWFYSWFYKNRKDKNIRLVVFFFIIVNL